MSDPDNNAPLATIEPDDFAHTAQGMDNSEALAAHLMDQLVRLTEISRLDTNIVASFMIVECFAMMTVYGGEAQKDTLAHIQHLIDGRILELQSAATADADPEPAVPAVPTGRTLH